MGDQVEEAVESVRDIYERFRGRLPEVNRRIGELTEEALAATCELSEVSTSVPDVVPLLKEQRWGVGFADDASVLEAVRLAVLRNRLKTVAYCLGAFPGGGVGVGAPAAVVIPVLFDFFVIVDFECTCLLEDSWRELDGTERQPRENSDFVQEIIEFAAVIVDGQTKQVIGDFHSYCRPELNPVLSDFCRELTRIDQATVDAADRFPEVLKKFRDWVDRMTSGKSFVLVTDGPTDLSKFLRKQCEVTGQELPNFAQQWVDIKTVFGSLFDDDRKGQGNKLVLDKQLREMMRFLGMKRQGDLHSGIDDARNIARLLIRLMDEGALVYPNQRMVLGKNADRTFDRVSPNVYFRER